MATCFSNFPVAETQYLTLTTQRRRDYFGPWLQCVVSWLVKQQVRVEGLGKRIAAHIMAVKKQTQKEGAREADMPVETTRLLGEIRSGLGPL